MVFMKPGCAPIVIGACASSVPVITIAVMEMVECNRIGYNAVSASIAQCP